MPALKGTDLNVTGTITQRTTAADGEVIVTCPLATCDWQAIRPMYAAWSAGEAHRIRHERGTLCR